MPIDFCIVRYYDAGYVQLTPVTERAVVWLRSHFPVEFEWQNGVMIGMESLNSVLDWAGQEGFTTMENN